MPLFRVEMTGTVSTTLIVKAPTWEAVRELTNDNWTEYREFSVEWHADNPQFIDALREDTEEVCHNGELNYDVEIDENGDDI